MPTYTFEDTKTGKVFDDYMSISDKEAYLKKNKHIKQLIKTNTNPIKAFIQHTNT